MARLHEYQGKAILAANGFKVPRGRAASNADEAVAAAKMIIGARVASSIANERKNSRSMSIFSSTSTASTGNCPTFIANIRLVRARTS